jgi:hypothetical protein
MESVIFLAKCGFIYIFFFIAYILPMFTLASSVIRIDNNRNLGEKSKVIFITLSSVVHMFFSYKLTITFLKEFSTIFVGI